MGLTAPPLVPNGVIVRLTGQSPNAELAVNTAQGNFTIRLADLPYGKMVPELGGRVTVDLVPPVAALTDDPQEQDYPAATAKDGTIWLAYIEFKHNPNHDRLRANLTQAPADFSE